MRDVTASRFVQTPPIILEQELTPARLVAFEDAFSVRDVTEATDGIYVVTAARGLEVVLVFEECPDGWSYRQDGTEGPYERMETTVTWRRENEGIRVTTSSSVAVDLFPRLLTERIAAWKREAELERLLDRLAAAVE